MTPTEMVLRYKSLAADAQALKGARQSVTERFRAQREEETRLKAQREAIEGDLSRLNAACDALAAERKQLVADYAAATGGRQLALDGRDPVEVAFVRARVRLMTAIKHHKLPPGDPAYVRIIGDYQDAHAALQEFVARRVAAGESVDLADIENELSANGLSAAA